MKMRVAGAKKLSPVCLEAGQERQCPLAAPLLAQAMTGSFPGFLAHPFT